MDETREPLLMLSVAIAVAVYKAIRYIQAGEAQAMVDCAALKAKNRELLGELKRMASELKRLREIYQDDDPDVPAVIRTSWDDLDPPF